jgi:hypothetical protein
VPLHGIGRKQYTLTEQGRSGNEDN